MKTNFSKVVVLVVLSFITMTAFSQQEKGNKKSTKSDKEIKTVCFKTNMHCNSCANTIKDNIAYEKGVKDLKVNLADSTVTIKYKSDKTSEEQLSGAIIDLGYTAKKQKISELDSDAKQPATLGNDKPKKRDVE